MAGSAVLTPAIIEELKRKGYNQAEIARLYGVSRQAVSKMKMTQGNYSRTPREIILEHFPWEPGDRFSDASPYKRMRDHAEYMATQGKGMSEDKLTRLVTFYNYIEENDLVVEFDPNIEPSEGIITGGFAYRPKQRSDGDLIIRVNEYTTLTEQGAMLWRLPARRPKIEKG